MPTLIRGTKHFLDLIHSSNKALHVLGFVATHAAEQIAFPMVDGRICLMTQEGCGGFRRPHIESEFIEDAYRLEFKKIIRQGDFHIDGIKSNVQHLCQGTTFTNYYVLDDDFESKYSRFLEENKKVLSNSIGKYISSDCGVSKLLFLLTEGNVNFFNWAAKLIARNRISIYSVKHLLEFNNDHGQLVKELSKQNLTAISNAQEITVAIKELFNLRAGVVAKQTLNWFNPMQKKLLRDKLNDNEAVQILNNFSRLSKTKRLNFIRKVSTIQDVDEVLRMMSFLCSNTHFEWNQESLLNFLTNVEGLNYTLVINRPNLVVVQVHDYETIKRLGKTTNWCISKNRSYWNNYMGCREKYCFQADNLTAATDNPIDARFMKLYKQDIQRYNDANNSNVSQFMVFDFSLKEDDKLSIVGITTRQDMGVIHAHNFVNDNMMNNGGLLLPRRGDSIDAAMEMWNRTDEEIKSDNSNLIYAFLAQHDISLGKLCAHSYDRCEWNMQSAIEFINSYAKKEDYEVLFKDDSHLLIRSSSDNISAIFPNIVNYVQLIGRINDDFEGDVKNVILHLDFTKPIDDSTKIIMFPIGTNEDENGNEYEFVLTEVNERCTEFAPSNPQGDFELLLNKFKLPFDTIQRQNTLDCRLKVYLDTKCEELIKSALLELKDGVTLSKKTQESMFHYIHMSIFGCHRLHFFEWLCANADFKVILNAQGLQELATVAFRMAFDAMGTYKFMMNNNLYQPTNTYDEICAYIDEVKAELVLHKDENQHVKQQRGNRACGMMNLNVNVFLVKFFMRKSIECGYKDIVNSIMPLFCHLIQHQRCLRSSSALSPLAVIMDMFTTFKDVWTNVTFSQLSDILSVVANKQLQAISMHGLELFFAANAIKPRTASMLIGLADDLAARYDMHPSAHKKLINAICTHSIAQHAISERTAKAIAEARFAAQKAKL